MERQTYAIVDLETTGHSSANGDRIIQIAIVFMKDWQILNSYTSFIHPGKSIPRFIQDLTKISNEDVCDAKPFEHHAAHIYSLLQDCIFVAHNTDFDLPFLQAEFKRSGLPKWQGKSIDTVELSKILFPTAYSYKLQDLASEQNINLHNAHRADDDAQATAELLRNCWFEIIKLPLTTLEQLHKRSFRLKSHISHLFFEAIQQKRKEVTQGSPYSFYKGIALIKRETASIDPSPHLNYPLSSQEKTELMCQTIPNFEVRPEQYRMMDCVWSTLNEKKELIAEASTGIGKTIAYLLPAVMYAKQQGVKIVVSTYTSHLLDQLLFQELPKVEKVLQCSVKASVLKGMHHYLDLERFLELFQSEDESYDETFTILQLLIWLSQTKTGDLNELNVSGGGQLLLDKIRKTTRAYDQFDFYEQVLQESQNADVIITNHAMLLTDLDRIEPIFKEIGGFIVDEAHQFLQAASTREEKVFSYTQWKYVFGQLGTNEDLQLFHSFYRFAIQNKNVSRRVLEHLEKKYHHMVKRFDDAISYVVASCQSLHAPKYMKKKMYLWEDLRLNKAPFQEVSQAIHQWTVSASEISNKFELDVNELTLEEAAILSDWRYWVRELTIKNAEWDAIFLQSESNDSTWVELDTRSIPGSLQVLQKPINIKEIIRTFTEPLRQKSSIIWTSGTLTVPGDERFIAEQLGLPSSVPLEQFMAPASFYEGASLYIVEDMPDIQQVSQMEYIESVADAIIQTVLVTEGRCFVLFTSQDMLRKTVELIQESELLRDYMLFAQGMSSGSRMRLLKQFQRFNRSVLFGTNSFWEGVDVPGETLSAVIVVRLPFSAPEEPVFKAKADALTKEGVNSFFKLALPEAILRFKQGFGRLIRSSQDKGVFIVLDRRIDSKSYGVEFIRALPPIPVKKVSLQHMVLELEHWYNKKV